MSYSLTLVAQADIEEIVTALWLENPETAELVEDRLYAAFDLLAGNPGLGHERADLTDRPVLFWPVRQTSYAAIYRPASPIQVIRVVHWHRDIASLL
ncbi:type II toxin-antitoxin system RelE/ParE family toxin [Pelagibius sp. CAU 1746]|uniref:type II toxin-antitoxin system RelE/ParE family toxin n=1 Tax=Pelagibius sp. CAU 1746 TaxID=3140370 RepID=UPI00325BEFC9